MKRVGLLLILFLIAVAACSPGGTGTAEQESESEEPTTFPVETAEPTEDAADGSEQASESEPPVETAGDPTAARERDWKLGNTVDPAVTIIEYGDFQ